jgi:D-alanyl-D-alanine dipeptidase
MTITSIASRLFAFAALVAAAATMSAPNVAAQPTAPQDFVSLADVDPTILQEIRYFTPHNFTGDPVVVACCVGSPISAGGSRRLGNHNRPAEVEV